MNISIEKITPEKAAEMLAANLHNRPLRPRHVRTMAMDMAAGNWRLNGEAVKFAKDGTLLDGQHRLAAIVESGATVEIMIVTGLETADQETMDAGRKRTLADVLSLRGEENANALASAITIHWRRKIGQITSNASPTTQQALRILDEQPGLRLSVTAVNKAARTLRIPQGMSAALHYEMATLNSEDAEDFWSRLTTGLGLHEKHPIYVLRRKLEENAATIGRKLDRVTIHAYVIKAWNAYREGREMAIIRWTRGGATPEPFPDLM